MAKETLNDRLSKIEKIRAELRKAEESASKDVMKLLQETMSENPLLAGVRWSQYTPNFNDGDVCEFGVNEPEFKFNLGGTPSKLEEEDEEEASDEGWYSDYQIDSKFFNKRTDIVNKDDIPGLQKTVENVQKIHEKLCSMGSTLQQMFGDGVMVTVTADGVETEDYDHD